MGAIREVHFYVSSDDVGEQLRAYKKIFELIEREMESHSLQGTVSVPEQAAESAAPMVDLSSAVQSAP